MGNGTVRVTFMASRKHNRTGSLNIISLPSLYCMYHSDVDQACVSVVEARRALQVLHDSRHFPTCLRIFLIIICMLSFK